MTDHVLLEAMESLIEQHGTSRKAALAVGMSEVFFCNVRRRSSTPPPRLLKVLGLKRTVVKTVIYEREAGK